MFNNRFNSSKNDPLLEAVKAARADGDARRLAESMANDLFGVYSRQAVVREYLSDYDYALEEAYKCVKEEDKMADKDYDRDGKIETSKKEVWGSRLRAAKASGKYKGPVDEKKMWEGSGVSGEDPGREVANQAAARQQAQTPSSTPARTGNAAGSTISNARAATGMNNEEALDEATRKHFRQHAADIAKISDQGERNKAASAAADTYARLNPRFDHAKFHAAAGSTAHQEPKKMDEAAYSAKAARAGKDIGKPGKMFSKIAKKAGEKYGSEERGKKVAGAILAKIRAKHMKEENLSELSAFGKEFAAARASGAKQFMSKVTGKMTTTALAQPSSRASSSRSTPSLGRTSDAADSLPSSSSSRIPSMAAAPAAKPTVGKYDFAGGRQGSAPEIKPDAPKPSVSKYDFAGGRQGSASDTVTGAPKVSSTPEPTPTASDSSSQKYNPTQSGDKATEIYGSIVNRGLNKARTSPEDLGSQINRQTTDTTADDSVASKAGAEKYSAPEKDASLKKSASSQVAESVMIGANKYRIV